MFHRVQVFQASARSVYLSLYSTLLSTLVLVQIIFLWTVSSAIFFYVASFVSSVFKVLVLPYNSRPFVEGIGKRLLKTSRFFRKNQPALKGAAKATAKHAPPPGWSRHPHDIWVSIPLLIWITSIHDAITKWIHEWCTNLDLHIYIYNICK